MEQLNVMTMEGKDSNGINKTFFGINNKKDNMPRGSVSRKTREMLMSLNRKLTEELEAVTEKEKQIVESINYAQRLQKAMMPTSDEINTFVKEHFILNLPKSVIGGDYYLVDSFLTRDERDLTAIALADCTGHGVPGALLSTLSYGILKNALADRNIKTAGEVLDYMKDNIANMFRSDTSNDRVRDGMDISLCIVDPQTKMLQFAGANQKGLIIKSDKKIIELIPDKQHIGYNEEVSKFCTNSIQLHDGDTIYLFSDGFRDQFGGEKGKKLLYKNFINKLIEISHHELSQQRYLLETFFNDWKKDLTQTDDVLVLGIRI